MKRVLLYGVSSLNVGDDLFFRILNDRFPNACFYFFSPEKYKKAYSCYKRWRIFTESDGLSKFFSFCGRFLRVSRLALLYSWIIIFYRVDLFLIIGGSLFMEGKSNLPEFISGVNKLRFLNRKMKIAIIGSNFGPSFTKQWVNDVESLFCTVDDVCLRDKASYRLFSHLPNVRWGNDIVMHMKPSIIKGKQKAVCINIRSVNNWPDLSVLRNKYVEKTLSIIGYFQDLGYKINLLSFCGEYGDKEITDELYSLLANKDSVTRYYYAGDLDVILDVISSSDYMVGTRFHAIVLGLVYHLRVLPISYSIKTENMLKTYRLWNDYYDYKCFCNSKTEVLLEHMIKDYSIEEENNTMFNYIESVL